MANVQTIILIALMATCVPTLADLCNAVVDGCEQKCALDDGALFKCGLELVPPPRMRRETAVHDDQADNQRLIPSDPDPRCVLTTDRAEKKDCDEILQDHLDGMEDADGDEKLDIIKAVLDPKWAPKGPGRSDGRSDDHATKCRLVMTPVVTRKPDQNSLLLTLLIKLRQIKRLYHDLSNRGSKGGGPALVDAGAGEENGNGGTDQRHSVSFKEESLRKAAQGVYEALGSIIDCHTVENDVPDWLTMTSVFMMMMDSHYMTSESISVSVIMEYPGSMKLAERYIIADRLNDLKNSGSPERWAAIESLSSYLAASESKDFDLSDPAGIDSLREVMEDVLPNPNKHISEYRSRDRRAGGFIISYESAATVNEGERRKPPAMRPGITRDAIPESTKSFGYDYCETISDAEQFLIGAASGQLKEVYVYRSRAMEDLKVVERLKYHDTDADRPPDAASLFPCADPDTSNLIYESTDLIRYALKTLAEDGLDEKLQILTSHRIGLMMTDVAKMIEYPGALQSSHMRVVDTDNRNDNPAMTNEELSIAALDWRSLEAAVASYITFPIGEDGYPNPNDQVDDFQESWELVEETLNSQDLFSAEVNAHLHGTIQKIIKFKKSVATIVSDCYEALADPFGD